MKLHILMRAILILAVVYFLAAIVAVGALRFPEDASGAPATQSMPAEQPNFPVVNDASTYRGPPLPATLSLQGRTQVAGISPGASGAAPAWGGPQPTEEQKASRTGSVLTSAQPLEAGSPLSASLRLPVANAPSSLSYTIVKVTPPEKEAQARIGLQWDFPLPTLNPLPLQPTQDIHLTLDPGDYVLVVMAEWQGFGRAEYGFYIRINKP